MNEHQKPNQPPNEDGLSVESEPDLTDWQSVLKRLEQGETAATREMFDRYSERLIRLASKHIHPALARRFDGEDVVQSVFRTFFRRHQEGKFQIHQAQQLWQLLVTITVFKTRSQARHHLAQCRSFQLEQALPPDLIRIDHEASPQDALALSEEVAAVLAGLPETAADILACRLEGKNKTEIADELGLTRQTIHRILKLVEQRLVKRFQGFLPNSNQD